jgi:hypothetical protein
MRLSDNSREAMAQGFQATVEAGTGDSTIQLRTGSAPASIGDAAAGTLLATVVLPATVFTSDGAGALTANVIATVQAVAAGTIGHFRVLDGDGNPVEDSNSVGTSSTQPVPELVLNTTTVDTDDDVEIQSWTWTMPAGSA